MKRITCLIRNFLRSQAGSTAIVFGLSSVVLIGAAGVAVDYSQASRAQATLQAAADATVLAAAQQSDIGQAELTKMAKSWLVANGGDATTAKSLKFSIKRKGDETLITIKAKTSTFLLAVLGKKNIEHVVKSRASGGVASDPFELVLSIDTTASMAAFGGNWPRAVNAFSLLVTKLKTNQKKNESTVAFIPFQDRVNVGKTQGATWHNVSGPLSGWDGCLEPREAPANGLSFMVNDDSPSSSPFVPTADGYFRWINLVGKPKCPQKISYPTNDPGDIETAMKSITPNGTGRFDVGLAWAWRMLSPKWKNKWDMKKYPSNYNDKRKMVIFLSDGFSHAYETEVHTAGKPIQPWGPNKGTPEAFDHFAKLCANMKDKNIELFMVYLQGNDEFKPTMETCATSPAHYFDVSNIGDLEQVLENIGKTATNIRLTR